MSFVKNSFYTLISNVIIIMFGFLTSVVISRTLGPQLKGVYDLAILMPTMMYNFLNFGQDVSIIYFLSNKTVDKKQAINNMFPVVIAYSIASTIIGGALIFILKEKVFNDVAYITLLLALTISPLTFLNSVLSGVLKSEGKFNVVNKIQVINKIIYLGICTILFIFVNVNIVILANIIILFISIITTWRKLEITSIKLSFDKEFQRKNTIYGFKSYLSNMITFLNYRLDTLIIKALTTTANVGQYSLAVGLAEQIWVFSSSISTVLFPYVSSIEEEKEKSRVTTLTFKIVLVFTLLIIVFLYLIASFIIPFLYTDVYEPAIEPFKVLLIGIFSLSLGRILANDIAARGKPELNTLSNIVGLVVNVILNLLLIPKIGILGAAVATSASYTITSIMFLISFLRVAKVSTIELFVFSKEDLEIINKFIKKILRRK
ncbi:MATE efflux family protein [uncultured Clostridium sp.]|uniref:flippase n=1 Tax=uncultured Clostridium sp. TaxID=59620 RepID=UPI000821F035|nr:flippase [uncultured Clostridium sp.]SCJ41684.1 MATE efflux family protein [uncultured Clostridium sp.]